MKYGFYDAEWEELEMRCRGSVFQREVEHFNRECFRGMMKRKTVDQDDLAMLRALTEMVEMLNKEVKNKKVVE